MDITSKNTEEQQPAPRGEGKEPPRDPEIKPGDIKKNPNPRANENLPEQDKKEETPGSRQGAGTEITDGEDG